MFPLQVDALGSDHSVRPDDWATAVHLELKRHDGDTKYLTDLASRYWSHLIIACKTQLPTDRLNPMT